MAQQFKVIINAGKSEEVQSLLAEQGAGQRGRPLIIKAKAGAKYQLVEMGKARDNNTDLAPDNIKAKRVGKHLHLMFETDTVADVIIEDYYDVMAEGYNGVIGKAENGSYYEYLTEDPTDPGLIPKLTDNATAVTQALGGAEVTPAGAAIAVAAFPLLGALGLLGGAAAVAAAANNNNGTTTTDSGVLGKNSLKTALMINPIATDNVLLASESGATTYTVTGKVTGTFAPGDVVYIKLNGTTYSAVVNADGAFSAVVTMADLKADPDTKIEASITPTNGDPATAAQDYTVESGNVPTQTALSINPVTADNIIGSTESSGVMAITGKVTGKFSAGDIVTLTINNKTFIGQAAADGSYSINVPTADLLADPDTQIEASVSGTGGTLAKAMQDYGIDSMPPTVVITAEKQLLAIGETTKITIRFSEEVNIGDESKLVVVGGVFVGEAEQSKEDPLVFTGTFKATTAGPAYIHIQSGLLEDLAGNFNADGNEANNKVTFTVTNQVTGELNSIAPNDSGVLGDNRTNDATPTLSGTVPTGATATVTINGQTYPVTVNPNGTWSFTQPTNLPDGTYTPVLNVTQNGVTSATNLTPFTVDSVTQVNIGNPGKVGAIDPISGTAEAGSTVVVKDANGQVIGTATANSAGVWSLTPSAPVPAGLITATATDAAGNTASDSDTPANSGNNPANNSLKTALTIDPIAADNVLLASESGATTYTVTGKVTGAFAPGDVVFLALHGKTYPAVVNADGAFSAIVTMADLKADPDTKIEASITPTNGDPATAAQDYTVESGNVPTQTALFINPVTADNIIGSTESSGVMAITGKVTGKYLPGDLVSLTINGHTYTGVSASDGSYSIPVSAADLLADPDTQIEASVSGTGGTLAKAVQDYGVNPNVNPASNTTGKLDAGTDSGVPGDNKTNDASPTLSGTVPTGATATVSINGQTYPVTVNPNGTWSFTQPNNLPDGTYYPILQVTQNGVTTPTNLTPFTIDTTPPTVAVTSNAAALGTGQSATITFTLSENSTDFTAADIAVTGGTLSNLTQSATDPKVYTATFTPTTSSAPSTGTISVASGKFNDAAANVNADGAEANNTISLTTNATTYGALQQAAPNDSGVVGDNKTNDTTPTLSGKVPAGSTASVTLNGQKYPVTVNPDGTWSFTNPTNLPDGTYTPVLEVTSAGVTTSPPITPFTIDTTAPTVVVTSSATNLAVGQTASLSFTLSEASSDFTADDIAITGGALSNFQKSATDPKIYTATFTPSSTGTQGTISVASGKFSDAAANFNADGTEANNTVTLSTNVSTSGQLAPASDNSTGTPNDGKTNDKTPELSGKVPAGATATVTLNGQTYPVAVNPDGTWSFTQPTDLPDGTYTPQLNITTGGVTITTPITPFTIDTTPPTVAIASTTNTLSADQSTTLTFTVSEPSTDLSDADFAVTGGKLGPLQQSATNPLVYTATFTAATGSTAASVSIASDKFADAAGNLNKDGAEANNTWSGTVTAAPADTTAPTIAISSNQASLSSGQTATITFTISEATSDFDATDIEVSGGTLGALTHVGVNSSGQDIYTAAFTPTANSIANGVVKVASDKFKDAAGNFNKDTYAAGVAGSTQETDNTVTLTVNTVSNTSSFTVTNDTNSVTEDGAAINGNVITNDSLATSISKVALSGGTDSTISAGTTSSTGTSVAGTFGSLKLGADGSYSYTIDNTKASVQALKAGDKVTDVFTYTATDGSGSKTANLTITITGTNDAPVAVADVASATEAGGAANATAGTNPTGNVLTNDTDVDTGDTKTVSAIHAGNATGTTGDSAVAAGTATSKAGSFGTISINADGSYTYTVDNTNATVQALLPTSTALTDTFTYTVKDAAGATSQQTITVSINGANDAPQVQVALVDQNATTGSSFSYTFAGNAGSATDTFKDVDTGHQTGLTYTATLTDGSSLPSWLSFNASTRTFSGTPPTGTTGPITVKVTASDALGLSTSDDFAINLTAAQTGDVTPPTIVVERANPASSLDAAGTETIIFTLSEASTTFDTSDIAVTGGTLSNFTPVGSSGTAASGYTKYTAVFTPTAGATGTATIGVASGKFADMAGNLNQDTYLSPAPTGAVTELATSNTNQVSVAFDTRSTNPVDNDKPTVQVSIDKSTLASGQSATLTFILSESSANFTLADIDVISGGGTVSNLLPVAGSNGVQYTATYTAGTTAGTVQIGVDASKFTDAAGNTNADTYKGSATGTTAVSNTTAETNNWVSLTNSGSSDTTAPTIAVTRSGTGTVSSTGETIVFTFSEGVATSSFTSADIDATGGTISSLAPVESSKTATGVYTQYTATYTPTTNSTGTGTISVAAGKFADAAANNNLDTYSASADTVSGHVVEANNQVVLSYNTSTSPATPDTTAPVIAISADKTTLTSGQTATISFTLSEASADFTSADVVVTGGTLSNFAGSGTSYTATFTPTSGSQGIGSVHVDSNAFRDAASNYNQDGADANNTVNFVTNSGNNPVADTTAPTIVVERLGSGTLTSSETIQFTLSEASKDFTLADIAVTGGTLTNLAAVPTSGTAGTGYTTYVATFTPTANSSGQATIGVASSKFSDAAGNTNLDTHINPATAPAVYEANNQVAISYNTINPSPDTTAPTIAVTRAGTSTLQSGGTDTVTFTLSEASLTFEQSDVTISGGGTLSNWSPVAASGSASTGYTVYTATYTPPTSGSGNVTIGVKASTFGDAAGNLNKDTFETGIAGTTVESNNQVTVAYNTSATDNVPPTVEVVRSATGTINGAETIYFNFSEATTDFALTDISASGGTMSNLVAVTGTGNKQYTATFTPTANSTTPAAIGVKAGTFSDATGNLNKDTFDSADTVSGKVVESNNQVTANVDTTGTSPIDETPPTVAISRVGNGAVTSAGDTIVFVFSEPVTGFILSDVVDTSTGSAASGLSNLVAVAGSGNTQFTATYTAPTASVGTVTLGIKAGTFTDAANPANSNKDTYEAGVAGTTQEANNQLTLGWNTDTTTPTVAITSSASNLSGSNTATITFTLSEASADFAQSMIDVAGGSLTNFQKSATDPKVYTATFTPNANSSGTATIGVLGDKFKDLAGNLNKDTYASTVPTGQSNDGNNQASISFDTRDGSFAVSNDSASVGEDGGTNNGNTGTALTSTTSGVTALNVLSNDSGSSMTVTAVKLSSASSTTAVASGSTSASSFTSVTGQYGTLHIGADGSYTYAVDNTNATVQALKGGTNTLSEVFTYSASGSAGGTSQTGNANLTITITGTNDAPVAVADMASATEAGGAANATAGTNPTGNVLTNDTDVDTGDTKTVSAIHAGNATGTTGDSAVAAGTATSKAGSFGTISINADGSYTYTVDNTNATVQALLPTSTALTDTFTYTVKDAAGATSQQTITVSINGANDAPTVASAIADKTATAGTAISSFNVVSNFADVDTAANGETVTYSATLADGSPLPSWLTINASTGAFSGTPPANTPASTLSIKATRTDAGGLSASDTFDIVISAAADTTAPKIAISSNQVSLATGQTATITFTLSEPSADFDGTDIETSGGSLGALNHVGVNSSGQDIYTATFTPNANSTVNGVVKVASDKFKDAAGNFNKDTYASGVSGTTQETDNTVTLTVNTTTSSNPTTPAGVKTALSIDPVTGDNVILNSENTGSINVTGKVSGTFAAGDTVTLTVHGTDFTGQVAADGSYSIAVPASDLAADTDTKVEGTVTGTGGDTATAAQDYTLESGNTVTQTALTIDRVTADNTVLASEADTNGDIAVTGKVSGKFANGDTVSLVVNGVTSTGTVNSLGLYSIKVKATDLLADSDTTIDGSVTGTGGTTATAVQNYALTDLAPPTVAISRASTGAMTAAETITFTLSEASTTFASTDVDVSGGLLSNWATSDNITYTATFTPTSGFFGSGAIGVKAGTFTDAAGNANKDTYEAFVTGTVLEENNLLDLSINTDTTPPTVIVSRSTNSTVTGAETITFTLSDNAGTSFDASDIFVTPGAGTLSNFVGDGTVFTATFTPTANSAGSVTIGVKAGKFSDPAGNLNKDTFDSADTVSGKVVETDNAVTFNYKTDNTAPTIAITGPSGTVSGPSTITFTLSEVSSDFEWDPTNPSASTNDIVVTGGGTLSALTPSSTTPGVFTATYTPPSTAGTGTATISVASNKFSDAAGNFNTDGGDTNNSLNVNFDTVTPTVIVSRATNATLGGTGSTAATETITYTLSEASSDFTSTDVVVSAGALSNWTAVSSTVYTATYTPPTGANAATGTATIGVRAGKFQDAAGNQNADDYTLTGGANSNAENNNNVVSVAYDTVAPTQTASFSSMTKDSGLSTGNANWTTADASAGRLVSGFVSAPLGTGETVNVYVDKGTGAVLLGTATVDAGGTTWAYTDTTNYVGATGATGNAAGWTYSAKVVDAAGNAGPTPSTSTQVVNGDYTEAAPVITAASDTASTPVLVGNDPAVTATNPTSTTNAIGSVSGTGVAGNTIYLYDNTETNLVGSATVLNNGTWTVTGLTGTYSGSNTFSAQQVDALGNQSVLSNLWTVTANSPSLFTNGDFSLGNTGFTSSGVYTSTGTSALTGGIYDDATPNYNVSTSYLSFDSVATPTDTASGTVSGINWTADYVTGHALTNPDGAMTGNVMFGGLVTTTPHQVIWSENVNVVAGRSYVFTFDYWDVGSHLEAAIGGVVIPFFQTTTLHEGGHFTAQFTATTTGPISLAVQGNGNGNGGALGNYALDNFAVTSTATPADNTLVAGGSAPATPNNDTALSYTAGTLDALAGNDTITVTSSSLQSTLAAGGTIKGGAGIDTLKLAAGTTLNLETLTGNQTVQKIQEVEILQMQGSSSLTLSANNVLSLGGSNASTMAPFSFSSTQQVADGSTAATGSTSSTGKVQMVIQGGTGDALKLDALATDGVSSAAGVLGNSGLTGTWAYKGQVQIGTITYKVYDHSTTQAQVLVDVPVVVTTVSPIAITAIDDANGSSTSANGSKDTGTSASDFITSDTTLVYRGTVPVEYNDANHDVFVEILNSSGTVVQSGTATVSNGTWSLDKTASALSAGNYTIRSTIVNQGTTTTTSSFGSQGVDTQALVIDTTAPTIIVARANNSTATLSTGQTETITFTLSEASTNFDVSDVAVSGGTLSNFGGSGTSYSATFTPTADTSGTGSISVASSKFSDAAGNQNADGAEGNNTASVPYVTAVPTQTVTFSSMTKDSSLALDNADWTTADGSAGRLVSGTLDAVLITGQVLKVYSNGTYIGDAVVNGKAWEITDTTGYTTGWTYTAKVQDGSGNTGPTTTQIVNTDFTEAAPVITSVIDTANASIGIGGTTTSALSTVSGTGTAGDTVYLYDNTGTNLVGSTTVAAGGAWSISGLATNDAVGGGANTFSARQMDSLGNVSVLSNAWTVTAAGSNSLTNGNFASGFTGFSSGLTSTGTTYSYTSTAGGFAVGPLSGAGAMNPVNTATTANSGPTAYTFGTWSKKTIASYVNPNGAFSGDALYGEVQQSTVATILSQNVKVTAGKTYTFKFDYATTAFDLQGLRAIIDGASIDVTTKNNGQESGQFSVTYVATSDKTINLSLTGGHTQDGNGDFVIDNVSFAPTPPAADGSLVQNGTLPGTAGIDGVVGTNNGAVLTYKGGAIDLIGGNDVLNANTDIQTLLSSSSNLINGGAGVDTLKLAAGTVLDLEALTNNQTVKTLEQVEIVQMQGSSTLTMNANDVLSLGGANGSTMSTYNFSSTNQVADGTTAATGSTTSTGKVQFVVNGTASDTLVLNTLQTDGVTSNGTIGNTGLAGQWDYKGTVQITGVDSILHTYAVYNQSTTQAQVLVDLAVNVMPENPALVTNVATFSSMTKDSGQAATAGVNADWTTNDASAGRLVSGTLASTLASGDVVKVYANGVLINGNATVNSAGTAWEITDTTGYTGSWAYTAQVVNSAGQGGAVTVQQVNLDVAAVAPVITSVTDSSGVRINNEGSTANRLGTVTGTGVAGETIHLYDNTGTNLVGSTVVTNDGTWSISGLSTNAAVGYGSNTFSARQVDAVGNTSAQSNLWTVLSTNGNTFTNGYFDGGSTNGFANSLTLGAPSGANDSYQVTQTGTGQTTSGTTDVVSGPTAYTFGTWSTKYLVGLTNPDGAMKDYTLNGQVSSTAVKTIWQQIAPVVTGKTYLFTFDYIQRDFVNQDMAVWIDGVKIQFVENAANQNQSGHFTATYVSAKTGNITISLEAANDGTGNLGDYTLDNFAFGPIAAPLPDGTLVAGGTPPGTAGVDGVVGVNNGSVLNYKGGSIDLIGGNDVLNAGANLQSLLTNTNNLINGGAGADILKLSAGTVLNLGALTANQTVKPISQMEIFQLQGNSVLTMTANDVLSLGGANGSTMSTYTFSSTNQVADGTTAATGSTTSTGKVQFVVNGTNTDVLVLDTLKLDGVTTNAIVGNTGLAGQWDYKGTVSITGVDGASHTYAVYDQSTTKAQVLVDLAVDVKLPTNASPTNAGVGLAVSISTDANNDGLVNSTELSTATNLTSHITVNNTAVVGDVVVVTATNGETALTPVSKTLTTTDITNGFDVTFAKPASGVKQVVTANYVSATSGPAADAAPTDSAEFIAAAPKVTVTIADKALTINETSLVTFQFSENVTGFAATDVSYLGGTLSALTKVNDSKWTATFTPTANTNTVGNIISVAADSYTNTAGVNGSAGQDTYSVDTRLSSAVAGRGIGVSGSESFNNVTTAITFGVSFPVLSGAVIRFQRNGVDVHTHTVTNSDNINYRETSNFNGDWGATITYQGQTVNLPRMQRVSFNNNIAGFSQFTSPLVMDLNGDGVQTLNMTDGVMFDLQASGQKSAVGWVSRGDGLLVMDLNSDGQITSGAELFGNHKLLANGSKAQDGWQALSELDSNGDGQMSAADADFAKLLVWVDANSDGVSDAGELQSLAEHGIVSINLGADQTRVAQNGNYLQGFSSYTRTDGTSHEIVDAWLEEASTNVAIVNQGVRDITGDVQANGQTSANVLKLNLTDVLAVQANANGQHQVIVLGDANDTVNLSNLLDTGAAQGSWQASGAVVQGGVTYNAYSNSADASLQVLIDQHITQVHVG